MVQEIVSWIPSDVVFFAQVKQFAVEVLRVIGSSPCQPDHAPFITMMKAIEFA